MVKHPKRPSRPPVFLMKHTRAKIDALTIRLNSMKEKELSDANTSKIEQLENRIDCWPRTAAGVTKEKKREIREEGGSIIHDFNFFLSDFDGEGPV
jgi:hypothetical protein